MTEIMNDELLWRTKLHARLHDPAEKALILMRKPEGHESGTVRELRRQVLGSPDVPAELDALLDRADRWASAADRPQFPRKSGEQRYPGWTQTRFTERPVLIHPLSGAELNIGKAAGKLSEVEVADIERFSARHFTSLIQRDDGTVHLYKTLLAFWRFGPELDEDHDTLKLGELWRLLPADTRTPDHTIWQHLDLASAFAGAGENPALLTVGFGPIQDFIAAGRSQSDLWAGSHFLSSIAWAGLKVLCEELGPDAVLFPQLRGVPVVDAWLAHDAGLGRDAFQARDAEWLRKETDANPLFVAALPNKMLALVPEARVRELAEKVRDAMRRFVMDTGDAALKRVLKEAGEHADDTSLPCFAQLQAQLQHFPEMYWAAAPWSLIAQSNDKPLDVSRLRELLQHFHTDEAGFLGSDAWQALSKNLDLGDGWFFKPNPGTLYPALYDLADKMLAAAKSLRSFEQAKQEGWRCSLAADVEWLTTDRTQLSLPPGGRKETLWAKLAKQRPSWVKQREHLGALAMLKRLWPTLFAEQVAQWLGSDRSRTDRFVVSSHTMALATSLKKVPALDDLPIWLQDVEPVALPNKLVRSLRDNRARLDAAKRIPGYLDAARDDNERETMERKVKTLLGGNLERYYGLILMDGDRMGAWLSGEMASTYNSIWHPQIRSAIERKFGENAALKKYCESRRAVSPAYHLSISGALNDFAIGLARYLVEETHTGKLLYAGGDDVLATVAVDDLLPLMQALRAGYSGDEHPLEGLTLKNGHAYLKGRLLRLTGEAATASMGAVIAHQMAPLSAVLRELRTAEKRAKTEGGRDAFSLTVIKRSGGALVLTAKWTQGESRPAALLERLRAFLADPAVSRRAVFNITRFLQDLPEGNPNMLDALLRYQFERQSSKFVCQHQDIASLTRALSQIYATDLKGLFNFLSVAEFMARETRAPEAMNEVAEGAAA
jgi:CRISPR-associated protein Cmr2